MDILFLQWEQVRLPDKLRKTSPFRRARMIKDGCCDTITADQNIIIMREKRIVILRVC